MTFSHDVSPVHMSIKEHLVAGKLPEATNHASVQTTDPGFQSLATRTDVPTTLQEMIKRGAPQLSLHITSFKDATLVGLAWPHTLMDAIGLEHLLRAWSLVLAGREADVQPVLGAREDIMWEIAREACEDEVAVDEALRSHIFLG